MQKPGYLCIKQQLKLQEKKHFQTIVLVQFQCVITKDFVKLMQKRGYLEKQQGKKLQIIKQQLQTISFSQFPTSKQAKTVQKIAQPSIISFSKFQAVSDISQQQIGQPFVIPKSNKVITSSKAIDHQSIEAKYDEENQAPNTDTELAYLFQTKNILSQGLVSKFLSFSAEKKMKLHKNQPNKISIKGNYESQNAQEYQTKTAFSKIKQILTLCLPSQSNFQQSQIYQLKTYLNRHNKAKLIQIAGKTENFEDFRDNFMRYLWSQDFLVTSIGDAVKFFLKTHEKIYKTLHIKIHQFNPLRPINSKGQLCQEGLELIRQTKQRETDIKKKMAKQKGLPPATERVLISDFYKQLCLQNIAQKSISAEKLVNFQEKKKRIKGTKSIQQIFNHLQIKDIFIAIAKKMNPLYESDKIFSDSDLTQIPFKKSIQSLQSLKKSVTPSPYQGIDRIALYIRQLNKDYNEYHRNLVKISEDIENIQLGIFCILMTDNSQLWSQIVMLQNFWANCENSGYNKQSKHISYLLEGVNFIMQKWQI